MVSYARIKPTQVFWGCSNHKRKAAGETRKG